MSEGRFIQRERDLLQRLAVLGEDRVKNHAVTEERYHTAARTAREAFEAATTALRETTERESAAARQRHQERVQEAEQGIDKKVARTQRTYAHEKESIGEKAEKNAGQAQRQMDEAIWVAETVFEAGERQPEQRFAVVEKGVDAMREELQRVARASRERVIQFRQKVVVEEVAARGRETPIVLPDGEPTEDDLIDAMDAARALGRSVHRLALPRLFKGAMLPCLALITLGGAGTGAAAFREWAIDQVVLGSIGGAAVLFAIIAVVFYFMSRRSVRSAYERLDHGVRFALALGDRAMEAAATRQARDERALLDTRERDTSRARSTYEPILKEIKERQSAHLERIEDKYPRLLEELRERRDEEMTEADQELAETLSRIEQHAQEETQRIEREHVRANEECATRHRDEHAALVTAWHDGMGDASRSLTSMLAESQGLFPEWDDPVWANWVPPTTFSPSIRFGRIAVDRHRIPGSIPDDPALAIDLADRFSLPITLDFPNACSMLLVTDGAGRAAAIETLQATMLRLVVGLPPGKVRFTILDPVALGQSFSAFMHLGDYDELFVTSRIWTETRHIEQRLTDITEHMENVIQKYLRNEFETIADYNEQAGEIAEPYRFLVVSDLPTNFTETAARRLASIISSGARCGVYTLLHFDRRQKLPPGLAIEDLEASSTVLSHRDGAFHWEDDSFTDLPVSVERFPNESFVNDVLHRVGEASRDATRVEVPFDVIAPPEDAYWSRECAKALTVPLGKCGATKLQELVIGPGTSQHALIAGKTGSGKSTLLHVLITNLALWYSPDEVQFYLIDFKKGVEFKTYAVHDLPHAEVVAVESDREFGLSVLRRIDVELKRRGDTFRELGVQDLAGYRRLGRDEPMPRVLLVIDEFQELFVEDDKIGQDAALLMDRVVRQGRAFGIHVLLGSQTLGGAYTLARSTIGQMQVRIALQCTEADSYLIMSEDNSAARLLSRPGEAIYNDAGGRIEGNSPFQIVWLPEPVREAKLMQAHTLAEENGWKRNAPLIVFEGNAPAEIDRNHELNAHLDRGRIDPERRAVEAWLGEAIAIKGPTCATFRRQSGGNLLMVGQRDEAVIAMFQTAMVSIAAQVEPAVSHTQIYLFDGTPLDAPHSGALATTLDQLPQCTRNVAWRDVEPSLQEIAQEVERRTADGDAAAPPIFVLIFSLQRFRTLRATDDFSFSVDEDAAPSPDKLFGTIVRDGPNVGIHTITWCDTAVNLNRTLERQGLREFEMRVLFQMSGADSTQLVDSPMATRLGLQRALFYNEESGVMEKFRPYALPSTEWFESVRRRLESLGSGTPSA